VIFAVYGFRKAGWGTQESVNWAKKTFPSKYKNSSLYTYILDINDKKYCNKCKKVLDKDNFSKNRANKLGLNSTCKNCFSIYQKDNAYIWRDIAAKKRSATPAWADLNKILEIYKECPKGYRVDHIIALNGKNISGLHIETNLQYLTERDNYRKGNKYPFNDYLDIIIKPKL
jgi:hypothetical protein